MPILRSRLAEEIARNREQWVQLNQLTREAMRRNELVMTNLINTSRDLISVTSDLRDESRAQRDALFRMMDKLDERLRPPNESP
jgi:hypothetical protein